VGALHFSLRIQDNQHGDVERAYNVNNINTQNDVGL